MFKKFFKNIVEQLNTVEFYIGYFYYNTVVWIYATIIGLGLAIFNIEDGKIIFILSMVLTTISFIFYINLNMLVNKNKGKQ